MSEQCHNFLFASPLEIRRFVHHHASWTGPKATPGTSLSYGPHLTYKKYNSVTCFYKLWSFITPDETSLTSGFVWINLKSIFSPVVLFQWDSDIPVYTAGVTCQYHQVLLLKSYFIHQMRGRVVWEGMRLTKHQKFLWGKIPINLFSPFPWLQYFLFF